MGRAKPHGRAGTNTPEKCEDQTTISLGPVVHQEIPPGQQLPAIGLEHQAHVRRRADRLPRYPGQSPQLVIEVDVLLRLTLLEREHRKSGLIDELCAFMITIDVPVIGLVIEAVPAYV